MKGMLKRALAGVAAAALAVTGLAVGASSASAAEGDVVLGTTITIQADSADQLGGRGFEYVKLASISASEGDDVASVVSVLTESGVENAVINALDNITNNDGEFYSSGDPMAWVSDNLMTDDYYGGSLREFVTVLANNISSWTTASDTDGADNATFTINVNAPGIYLVRETTQSTGTSDEYTSSIPMLVSTAVSLSDNASEDTTDKDIPSSSGVVELKNETTPVSKSVDSSAASIGDEKTYTITASVPNWNGKTGTEFKFTDTPTKGQTVHFDKITVEIVDTDAEGTEVVKASLGDTDYTLTKPSDVETDTWEATYDPTSDNTTDESNSFSIDLTNWMNTNYSEYLGMTVKVTYTVTINKDAVTACGVYNLVDLNNDGATTSDSTVSELVKTATVTFTKVDAGNSPLAGAKFTISRYDENTATWIGLYQDATSLVWSDVTTENPATVFVSAVETGVVTINGLGEGVYKITETNPPTGYLDMSVSFIATVDKDGTVTFSTQHSGENLDGYGLVSISNEDKTAQVMNVTSITQLPQTGAAGIALFVVLGLLIAGAGAAVWMKSRSVRNAING